MRSRRSQRHGGAAHVVRDQHRRPAVRPPAAQLHRREQDTRGAGAGRLSRAANGPQQAQLPLGVVPDARPRGSITDFGRFVDDIGASEVVLALEERRKKRHEMQRQEKEIGWCHLPSRKTSYVEH